MLNYCFEKYKKHMFLFGIIFLSLTFYFFYSFESEEIVEKRVLENKILNENTFNEDEFNKEVKLIIKEENKVILTEVKSDEKPIKKELKKYILASATSKNGHYSIKLISNNKIERKELASKYIILTGTITDGYGESDFPMSINEDYLEDISVLSFEINDNQNNLKSVCESYFLDSLSPSFSYHMKIEFIEQTSDCYILSQSDFVEQDLHSEEKEYVKIKDNSMGVLANKQIDIKNKEDINQLKITEVLK